MSFDSQCTIYKLCTAELIQKAPQS